MSTATAFAAAPALQGCKWERCVPARRFPVRLVRGLVLCFLFTLVFLPEYVQGRGDPGDKSRLYLQAAGGFRYIDLAILVLFAVHAVGLSCSRRKRVAFPRVPLVMASGFGVAIVFSACYGALHGGENLFFDWRAIALGACLFLVYSFWMQSGAEAQSAANLLGVTVAAQIVLFLVLYAAGKGDVLLGIRIPVFDGPTLSALVCIAVIGLSLSERDSGWKCRGGWLLLSGLASAVTVLSFRRTYWAELAIGVALLTWARRGHRHLRSMAILLTAAGAAALLLGSSLYGRLQSLDFTSGDSQYAMDNADHVGDVLDAWDEVRQAPITGIGLGRSYPTWRIRDWKEESVMVHDAPLHVWLKYGLAGLCFYLAYHITLFRQLQQRRRRLPYGEGAAVAAVLAYLAAQFLVSLGFTPWPYSAVQSTNLIAFLLAVAFAGTHHVTTNHLSCYPNH